MPGIFRGANLAFLKHNSGNISVKTLMRRKQAVSAGYKAKGNRLIFMNLGAVSSPTERTCLGGLFGACEYRYKYPTSAAASGVVSEDR